ncbi:fimbrial biogenesis usher protein [Leclercia sp.]|uniref:fimbrial biogenesis usher protein n=1 Tax=Leclercia sp. TaxID=1898428 RepID=UPI002FDC9B05
MFKRTLLACAASLFCSETAGAADTEMASVEFDQETLKSLGINPSISHYFSKKARFMPGDTPVTLSVNGHDRGRVIARFDDDGKLCLDNAFLQQASLLIPDESNQDCYDYQQRFPGAVINVLPGQERVEMIVPPDQLARPTMVSDNAITGGRAALLNYTVMSSRNDYDGGSSDYSQAQLDGGVNIADWMLRTHQMLSRSNGRFNSENSQTYLQRTFAGLRTTGQFGEVSMNNPLLNGTGLYGVAFSPEGALMDAGSAVQVSGIANTSQARVEVRQQGILVASTLVPVGPFTLNDIALRNYTSDLNVTVIETDGSQHSFVVPSALYRQRMGNPAGVFLSVGRVSDDYSKQPWVASLSKGWRLTNAARGNVAVIMAKAYQGVGVSIDTAPLPELTLSVKGKQSLERDESRQGQNVELSLSAETPLGVSVTASAAHYTQNFREFSDSLDKHYTHPRKREYAVGLRWQHPTLGAISTSIYETQHFNDRGKTRYLNASWGRKLFSSYLSANWQHQLSNDRNGVKTEDQLYINLSIPLGGQSVSTYVRRDGDRNRIGSTASGKLTDDSAYTLGIEHEMKENENSFNAGISSNLHYSQLMLNAAQNGDRSRNYSGSLQGGVVAHGGGVTFSPLPVNDTFAIASLDYPVAGIKIETPQGPVWSDYSGQAVIPSLNAWRDSRLEVSTETLPKNMDIANGVKMVNQGRGSVGRITFTAISQRRLLLSVHMADGKKLPKGTAIRDNNGRYLTTAVDDGVVFLNDVHPRQTLVAELEQGVCSIMLALPDQPEVNVFYETAKGTCQ